MNGITVPRPFISPTFGSRSITIRNVLIGGVLPALAGALLLAGCSGGGAASTPAAGASPGGSASATASTVSAFETCLKQHGVKIRAGQFGARPTGSFTARAFPSGSFTPRAFPSGSPHPGATFFATDSAAFRACAKYAPAGFARGNSRAISSSALAAFKSCLTSNGVKVTGTTAAQILSELRNSTGKTATALHTCQVLLQPTIPTPTPSS